MSTKSDPVKLSVLLSLPLGEVKNRSKRDEGRLFPPEEMMANPRGDQEFQMTTETSTFDPYSRNDLDDEEPLDGRYFIRLTAKPKTTKKQDEETTTEWRSGGKPGKETKEMVKKYATSTPTSLAPALTNGTSTKSGGGPSTSLSLSTVAQTKTTPTPSKVASKSPTSTTKMSSPMPSKTPSTMSFPTSPLINNGSENSSSSSEYQPSSVTITFPTSPTKPACQDLTTVFSYDAEDLFQLTEAQRVKLRELCWETMLGQEIAKTVVMDLFGVIFTVVVGEFGRAVIIRYCNDCSCFFWDLEKHVPGYPDFQIAENILHLVNNQGNMWLGMFFSPGLAAFNTLKLCIMMYIRSWAVLTSNIPHDIVFKASGSNNFYYSLLLLMLFINVLPVGYAVVWLEPSWHCGPFSKYHRIYRVFTKYLEDTLPKKINAIIDYLSSPGTVIPVLMLLILLIYYLMSTVSSLRETNSELKSALRKEKDTSEEDGQDENRANPIPEDILTPGLEKKHVRISDDIVDDSDKARLISDK